MYALERDVVVGSGGRHGGAIEVAGVDRDVALRGARAARETAPVAGAGVVTTAEELHGLSDDINRLPLVAVLVGPFAPLQPAVDRHAAALRQVAAAVLALLAPDGHVEVVGHVLPLLRVPVLATPVAGDAHRAQRRPAGQRLHLGVAGQVAGDDHPVDVPSSHLHGSFLSTIRSSCPSLWAGQTAEPILPGKSAKS